MGTDNAQSTDSAGTVNSIEHIGKVAGMIWHHLESGGAIPVNRLVKEIDAPRDAVMQGMGWLAREGKIRFAERQRSRWIELA